MRCFEMRDGGAPAIALDILHQEWIDHARPEVTGPAGVRSAVKRSQPSPLAGPHPGLPHGRNVDLSRRHAMSLTDEFRRSPAFCGHPPDCPRLRGGQPWAATPQATYRSMERRAATTRPVS